MDQRFFRGIGCAALLFGGLSVAACDDDPSSSPLISDQHSAGRRADADARDGGGDVGRGDLVAVSGAVDAGSGSCTATRVAAAPLPVDVFVLLDRSGSMLEPIMGFGIGGAAMPIPGAPTKWDSMRAALDTLVRSPVAAGLAMGLGYFPLDTQNQCTVAGYAIPAVPIEALPAVAPAFERSIEASTPNARARTPTLPALQGAITYLQQRAETTGRRVAIALATDGEPNACNSTLATVSGAAQRAAAQGIHTFVIGVGPSLQNLDAIAAAGGTVRASLVEMATADQLVAAFRAVQTQASKLACSFLIPPPPAGTRLDAGSLNVRFEARIPSGSFDISMVSDPEACGSDGGWFYDDAAHPRAIELCEESCNRVNGGGDGEIVLLFGCAGPSAMGVWRSPRPHSEIRRSLQEARPAAEDSSLLGKRVVPHRFS